MDIKPPPKKKPELPRPAIDPVYVETSPQQSQLSKKWSRRQWVSFGLVGLACAIVAATLSVGIWYQWALQPPSDKSDAVRVVVRQGQAAADIAETLHDHQLIRSKLAFALYVQISGQRSKLQAGGYVLSPNQNVESIVEHMTTGKTDEFTITIPPGLTLDELRTHFIKNGFTDEEVTSAFEANYSHPLLSTRPTGADLEGYIYPETYRMNADQSLGTLLERSFDDLYTLLTDKMYLDEFAKRNLTVHEGITMASIVQKEVKDPTDQKQVAQVFLKRLKEGIQLGSDVTYMYAAEKTGQRATPALESPYNTRKYPGIPPGPISNMNPSALEAVAFPAQGDFLYFVAGDDGVTYFSRTEAEHEANVQAHCTTLCQ